MQSEEIQITLSGQAAQKLRAAFPSAHLSLNRKAEKIIVQWLEDSADIKAADTADTAERQSKGKRNVRAADLFAQCDL